MRCLKFNRTGKLLFAGNEDGEIVIFDVAQGIPLDVINSSQKRAIWSMDISWGDKILALGTESGTIELYSV